MNLYKRTITAIIPFWKQLVTASLSAAVHAILSGMLVWMVGPLLMTLFQVNGVESKIDSVVEQPLDPSATSEIVKDLSGSVDSFKEDMKNWINELVLADTRQNTLVKFCWLIMIVVVGKNLFLYLQGFFMAFVQQSIIRSFRDKLFSKYQRLSLDYFHSRRTGQIISRVTNDVVVLNESIDIGFNRLVTDSIMVILFAAFLIVISWKLTLLAMVIMPLVFIFIWFIGKKLRKYSERSQERMADVNAVLEESVNNIRIVKAFSMENFEIKKFSEATFNFFRALLRMTRIRHLASPINDTLTSIAGVIILIYAGSQIIDGTGELDAGDFMTYVVAMFSLIKPVKSLSQIHIKLQEGMAAAERIFNVLDTPEKVSDPTTPKILSNLDDSINYSNISFSYNGTDKVLDDISFTVKKGEVVAFVGPSGGGKSTLLDLLPRFYDPLEGSISIDNYNIKEVSLNSLRSLMGIVTQETYLFN
ncbi:MAG: ABC transporter ATP-binding protein, partial [candidate division Zixibacteria bacterium]|nr:ABC transporter ATP-binding protein [candidate division Zixibacteria bacterium]